MSKPAETHTTLTPILDRLVPLPSQAPPRSNYTVVIVVWTCILAALAVGLLLGRPPILRQWLLDNVHYWFDGHKIWPLIGFFALSYIGVFFAMLTIHEGGHAVGGLAMGFRFKSIRLGPFHFNNRPFRLSFYRAVVSGAAEVIPSTTNNLVRSGMVMFWAGPAANILSGCLALFLPFSKGFASVLFIILSIGNGLSDLLPYRSKYGLSDGKALWMLFRHPARGERYLAIMRLSSETGDGVLPELLPADFIEKAIAVRDDSIETVSAHAFAFSAAFHQHKDAEAGNMLEVCLKYSGYAPPALREALMSDAAVFQARRRKRADLAQQWLADLPPTTHIPGLRSRAEAAIFEAQGNIQGALGKLEEFEKALIGLPNAAQREYLLKLLRRWKSELSECERENSQLPA